MSQENQNHNGREALSDYPWKSEMKRLLLWLQDKDATTRAFCFDLVMSLAYMDSTPDITKSIEQCDNIDRSYNSHVSFINLCAPCYFGDDILNFQYQKAAKPESGVLGKLSSEVILYFIEMLHSQLESVKVIGGTSEADAILQHKNGLTIYAEVKSAPLLTYPFVFNLPQNCLRGHHQKITISNSQLKDCKSGIYVHNVGIIDLGKVDGTLWPFKPLVDFILNPSHASNVEQCVQAWVSARDAYIHKSKNEKIYYVTNACGKSPTKLTANSSKLKKESISDSKTSAGMDRTDDIKKGIYQTLKIGTLFVDNPNIKTAIISNLPAYRHRHEYVSPFENMLWSTDAHLQEIEGVRVIYEKNLRRVFDYIITLDEPTLRNIEF